MHQPLISIIITILNGEKTLSHCLASIESQTFSDYELVIVDGGSKDRTVQIINESPILNKTIRVLPGIGLYAGLNAGIKLSVGKWLYFIGADDALSSPDILQKVSEIIKNIKNNIKVVVGSVECIKQGTLLQPMFGSPYWMRHQVHHQGMFYDRNIFNNSLYNETMRIASDYEFNLRLALIGIPHQAMDIVICNFGGDGISENQMEHGYKEMQKIHQQLFKGIGRHWAMNYFWLRRSMSAILRRYKLSKLSMGLKKVFG
ncbi:glycosyltransferase [Spirosoma endbachense]|uniref:Glycosyltransferase n=1 Tax=Spirosoma endbachense TaxID=2666025 RepID=A0A6P1W9T6_9BACT|nr:glycosyltransferase [Spirosoma endbachense]QHW00497.1 glycosyltransferase [Spirosoma endbachense]